MDGGTRYRGDRPAVWALAAFLTDPEVLPVLEPGAVGEALFFLPGGNVVGSATDAEGQWLAEWARSGHARTIRRLRLLPPRGPLPRLASADGLAFGNGCAEPVTCDPLYDLRACAWTTPSEPPIPLPTLADLRTFVSGVSGGGLAAGTAHVKGLTSHRPVLWPDPSSIVELPLPSKGSAGAASDVNDARQMVGTVTLSEKGSSRVVPVLWTLP